MSIVRHKNKKSGSIIVYESTSHYDPVTKQSRPKRKYLGIEDPETGELIPSSGKRGRKRAGTEKKDVPEVKNPELDCRRLCQEMEKGLKEKDSRIQTLEQENASLRSVLERVGSMASEILKPAAR